MSKSAKVSMSTEDLLKRIEDFKCRDRSIVELNESQNEEMEVTEQKHRELMEKLAEKQEKEVEKLEKRLEMEIEELNDRHVDEMDALVAKFKYLFD